MRAIQVRWGPKRCPGRYRLTFWSYKWKRETTTGSYNLLNCINIFWPRAPQTVLRARFSIHKHYTLFFCIRPKAYSFSYSKFLQNASKQTEITRAIKLVQWAWDEKNRRDRIPTTDDQPGEAIINQSIQTYGAVSAPLAGNYMVAP